MPTYRYKAQDPSECPLCGDEGFETLQPLSEPPLTSCPTCQLPLRRVIGGATCVTERRWNEKKLLSDDNLRAKGFKKLVKDGDGKYRNILAD